MGCLGLYLLRVVPQSVIADQGSLYSDLGAVKETAPQTANHFKGQQTAETELPQAQRFVANRHLREFSGLFGLQKFCCTQSSERNCQGRERDPCASALMVTDFIPLGAAHSLGMSHHPYYQFT